ncbi:MAG: sigma factor-like helix-turn-helix DNA-binding protein, partial [Bacteroidota bacterium]|nr:sigma factor-like helix-turn-helix DNA-binding protein [Bacteroidota bacterium]
DLSNKEIAEKLGISVKTVENQMTIALKKLREYLLPFRGKIFLLFLYHFLS